MLKSRVVDKVIITAQKTHVAQAYHFLDRLIAAKDTVTGLLPVHVKTEDGKLRPVDHISSGLDMGRTSAGLVMLSKLAGAGGDPVRADRYLKVAKENYKRGKELLAVRDYFVHRRDFNDQGAPTITEVGEPNKSAPGEDNMSRVNSRAYAFRAAAELYLATREENYKTDFVEYFNAWIRDFYDPTNAGFFIHGNIIDPLDHKEIDTFKYLGGVDSEYDGRQGIKGNDGVIYALSSILLQANEILGIQQVYDLVKEQLDIILRKLRWHNGLIWENYTNDWKPISVGWQNQPMDAPESQSVKTSHVAIGGHTAMAFQQIIEGARQLFKQEKLSEAEYASYIDQALSMFQEFAAQSGAIDWNTGVVHNAMRVEEPRIEHRWLRGWGDASWQQAELIQTLLRFREEDLLQDIKGPDGKTGEELLDLAEQYYFTTYAIPINYSFTEYFGNPDVYHRPQLALYHYEVISRLDSEFSNRRRST
jgi:hypothetical protein